MYTLYYSPGSCAMAVHVALLECKATATIEKVDLQAPRSAEFLKLNPRGQVPVLVDGDTAIREGAAILIHLLEKEKSALLPSQEPQRTQALQWLMFCNASLHPAYSRMFFLLGNKQSDSDTHYIEAGLKALNKLWHEVEARLHHSPYLAGDDLTMADILMTVIANWSPRMPGAVEIGPKTKALLAKISARPSFVQAMQEEGVEYKAAA